MLGPQAKGQLNARSRNPGSDPVAVNQAKEDGTLLSKVEVVCILVVVNLSVVYLCSCRVGVVSLERL